MQVVKGKVESVKKLPRRDGTGYFYRVIFGGQKYLCFDPKIEEAEGMELEMETTEVEKDGEITRYLRFPKAKKPEEDIEITKQRNGEEKWWGSETQKRVNLMSYAECCVRDITIALISKTPEEKINSEMVNTLYDIVQKRILKLYDAMLQKVNANKTEEDIKEIVSKLITAAESKGYSVSDLMELISPIISVKDLWDRLTFKDVFDVYNEMRNCSPKE
jgi:hypothetical protein